jgi:hypothetical protein
MRRLTILTATFVAVFVLLNGAVSAQTRADTPPATGVDALNARLNSYLDTLPQPNVTHASLVATTVAQSVSTTTSCRAGKGRAAVRWLTYAAQGLDAFVVAAAVRHGARERVGFGNARTPVPFVLVFAVEDFAVDQAFRGACPSAQNTATFLLGLPAAINAATTRTTP